MNFVLRYTKAKSFKEKAKCFIAKMLRGYVVTPLGRIMLLPSEYNRLAMVTGNKDLVDEKIEKKGQSQMVDKEAIVDDLNMAKLMLCNQQMLTPEMRVRIGQAITSAIDLLREDEVGMIVITTMRSLPNYCYDCPCHDGEYSTCEADKEKRSTFEYRPYWCPLKEINRNVDAIKEE